MTQPKPVELSGVPPGPSHEMLFFRALEQLEAFESAAKAWREVSADTISVDVDPQVVRDMQPDNPFKKVHPGEVGVELRFSEAYPINPNWALPVNESIHALRSCLDHLAYALACANTKGPLPRSVVEGSEFPIYGKSALSDAIAKKKIGAIHPKAQAIIKELQPHLEADYRMNHLWALHELDRVGKHRLLPIVGANVTKNVVSLGGDSNANMPHMILLGGPVKDSAPVAYFVLAPRDPEREMKVDGVIAYDIDFGDNLPSLGSCSETVAVIGHYIGTKVFPALEPFLTL